MSEGEWWHLKQVVELASKVYVKQEERAQAASAGARFARALLTSGVTKGAANASHNRQA